MKKNLIRIGFVLLFIVTLIFLNRLLSIKTEHGIKQAQALYYQPRESVDVVMMGSSHIHCDINTGLLWEKYGISAYDYSAAEQPLWITYYYLKEFCKYQSPKVVVLDLYSPARFKEDYQYDWIADNLYGMRFSINKLQMLWDSVEKNRISDYFPAFFHYHSRYKDLKEEDFKAVLAWEGELASFKGYTPYLNVEPQIEPELKEEHSGGLTVKSEVYLIKIIEYAKKNDIELFLIVTPYITTDEDETVYNRIKEIAQQYGLQFNSTNYDYDEIGLDFEKDFNDYSHLNYWGSCKFTDYLGKQLLERYEIPDRRGEEGFESWDENAEEIKRYVKAG